MHVSQLKVLSIFTSNFCKLFQFIHIIINISTIISIKGLIIGICQITRLLPFKRINTNILNIQIEIIGGVGGVQKRICQLIMDTSTCGLHMRNSLKGDNFPS